MTRLTSPIYHRAHSDPPTGAEAKRRNREAMAKAWHERGLAAIDPEEVADDWTRQAIINTADKLYGKRGQ